MTGVTYMFEYKYLSFLVIINGASNVCAYFPRNRDFLPKRNLTFFRPLVLPYHWSHNLFGFCGLTEEFILVQTPRRVLRESFPEIIESQRTEIRKIRTPSVAGSLRRHRPPLSLTYGGNSVWPHVWPDWAITQRAQYVCVVSASVRGDSELGVQGEITTSAATYSSHRFVSCSQPIRYTNFTDTTGIGLKRGFLGAVYIALGTFELVNPLKPSFVIWFHFECSTP